MYNILIVNISYEITTTNHHQYFDDELELENVWFHNTRACVCINFISSSLDIACLPFFYFEVIVG